MTSPSDDGRASGGGHKTDDRGEERLRQLIEAARQGRCEAFDALFAGCRDYLLAVARSRLDPTLGAKVAPSSIVQETLLQAHQHFERFKGDSEQELLAWLAAILETNVKAAWRFHAGTKKRDFRRELSLDAGLDARILEQLAADNCPPDAPAIQDDEALWLARAMRGLSDEHRAVITMRTFQGMPFAEVGNALGRTESAARNLWVRAVQKLTKQLDPTNGTCG